MRIRMSFLLITLLIVTLVPLPSLAFADGIEDLRDANTYVTSALDAAKSGDIENARVQFETFSKTWFSIEEGIKGKSKQAYKDIEDAMGQLQFFFVQNPVIPEKVVDGLEQLNSTNMKFIEGQYPVDQESSQSNANVNSLVLLLNDALTQLNNHEVDGAAKNIEKFRSLWLDIEGVVLTQSSKVYKDTERDMVTAYALLKSNPPDTTAASALIKDMRDYLAPLASKTSYTMFDATTILLREGLEALLVIIALLGFMKKTGNESKQKWIWYGVGSGLIVSVILGVIVQLLFSAGAFGNNNFIIMGWTGIFAAVMLLYMSYWLHSKSSIAAWNKYISAKSNAALATGSLVSLAVLSFLAIFREGTETVIFFIGMASSISFTSLLSGIGIGILALLILSYLVIKIGLKIPMRPFLIVSSLFVFYLCFKFTGMGIHGLQLSGILPATHSEAIPTLDFLAVYATWESTIPQLILVFAALTVVIWNKLKQGNLLILNKAKGEI